MSIEGPKFPQIEPGPINLEEIETLLDQAQELEKEIDERTRTIQTLMTEREEILKKLKRRYKVIEKAKISLRELAEKKKNLLAIDYQILQKEGIINEEEAEKFTQLLLVIKNLEDRIEEEISSKRTLDQNLQNKTNFLLQKLKKQKEKIDQIIERRIKETIKDRGKRLGEYYRRKISPLKTRLREIEQKPMVQIEIKRLELEESLQFFKKEILPPYQSIRARHDNTVRKLEEITKIKNIKEKLFEAWESKNKQLFNEIRKMVINNLLEGKIKDISEIVPWLMKSSYHHGQSLEFLKGKECKKVLESLINNGNETAKKLYDDIENINKEVIVLRSLFSQEFRKELDEILKKDKERIEFEKKKKEVLKQGWILAYENKREVLVKPELELRKKKGSSEGKYFLLCRIADILSYPDPSPTLKKNAVSVISVFRNEITTPQFPNWLRPYIMEWIKKQENEGKLSEEVKRTLEEIKKERK